MADKISSHEGVAENEFLNVYQAINSIDTSTMVSISSGAGAPATTPGKVGDIYLDTTAKREYRAYGTSSSADWLKVPVFYSGTITITSGGGDKTITLPWDWSGGFIKVYCSGATTTWVDGGAITNQILIESSYDAITNAGYTTLQNVHHRLASNFHLGATKTDNVSGIPKSATSTTVVLDDGGVTMYCKYFIWA